jgi:hypothetical protein
MKLLIAVVFCILFVGSLWLYDGKKPTYQTSEFEYNGHFNNWVILLCESAGIDPNGCWQIECPKCPASEENRGRTEHSAEGWELRNFCTKPVPLIDELKPGEKVEIKLPYSNLFCSACLYPIGTDWHIRDLSAIHIEGGCEFVIEGNTFVSVDPNLDNVAFYGVADL